MAKGKNILNATLKALLAGAETSAWVKIPATFIAEIASLPKDKQKELADLSPEQFDKILLQSELATSNAALAAVGTEQIQLLVSNASKLSQEQLDELIEELRNHSIIINDTNKVVRGNSRTLGELLTSIKELHKKIEDLPTGDRVNDEGILVKGNAKVNIVKEAKVEGDQYIDCDIKTEQHHHHYPPKTEPVAPPDTIHNIPYNSLGGLFKGRENDYDKLVKQLDDKTSTTAITQAISGLGGMGKTRLAVEYGWHALDQGQYQAVLFANCSQELAGKDDPGDAQQQQNRKMSAFERLCVEMGKLAAANLLDIAGVDAMDPQPAAEAVLKELHQRDRWLMVFDNVDEPAMANAVNAVLPQLSKGKVIITSRLSNFTGNIKPLSLKKLTPEASIEYLLAKTDGERLPLDNDQEKVKELAAKLDGLPVALEQAAAFINHRQISFEAYLDKFKVMEGKLLGFNAEESGLGKDFKPVLTVWALTEEQLGPVARAVNTLAAFLAPEAIPVSLFVNQNEGVLLTAGVLDADYKPDQHKNCSEAEKTDIVEDAIAQLDGFSMITRDPSESCFSIHRLVQEVTRLRLSQGHIDIFTQLILQMIHKDCPDYQTAIKTNYAWHKTMDSHISGLIAYSQQLWPQVTDIPAPIATNLATQINNMATLYKETNRLAEAEPLMQRVVAILENPGGEPLPNYAGALNNLAGLLKATNQLEEAEPLMRRALAIDEDAFGDDHPNVATALNNLAQLLMATNRLKEAEPLMQRVVTIFEKAYGENHPNVATALNNLAQLLKATNRIEEAEPLMRRALAIDEDSFDADHPDVARDLNNLAQLLQDTNRTEEAEPLMRRALAIDEASFGADHPDVARDLNNLAALLQATNRLEKAEPLMQRVVTIFEKAYGENHPNVATALNNLAQLLKATNRIEEAEPLMQRHLVIFLRFTRRTGHPHPHLKDAINNYKRLLMQMGESKEQIDARLKGLDLEIF